jgi:hypothetical protein
VGVAAARRGRLLPHPLLPCERRVPGEHAQD